MNPQITDDITTEQNKEIGMQILWDRLYGDMIFYFCTLP